MTVNTLSTRTLKQSRSLAQWIRTLLPTARCPRSAVNKTRRQSNCPYESQNKLTEIGADVAFPRLGDDLQPRARFVAADPAQGLERAGFRGGSRFVPRRERKFGGRERVAPGSEEKSENKFCLDTATR